jgi:hypothetical protein
MNDKEIAEVLMAYADDLNRGAVDRGKYLERVSGHGDELEALLHLAERLKRTLVPIRPSLTFVNDLARQLAFSGSGEAEHAARGHRREIFIGAAAIGSALSVIGLVAYLVRNRMQVKTQVASAR